MWRTHTSTFIKTFFPFPLFLQLFLSFNTHVFLLLVLSAVNNCWHVIPIFLPNHHPPFFLTNNTIICSNNYFFLITRRFHLAILPLHLPVTHVRHTNIHIFFQFTFPFTTLPLRLPFQVFTCAHIFTHHWLFLPTFLKRMKTATESLPVRGCVSGAMWFKL